MKCLSGLFALLLLASCASHNYDPILGTPRLSFVQPPRTAVVGQMYPLRAYWWGQVPAPDQYLMFVLKVMGEERSTKVGTLYGRLVPGGDEAFYLLFSVEDYYEAAGRIGGEGFRSYIVPRQELETLGYAYDDNPSVSIELTVYEALQNPTNPNDWKRGKIWVRRTHSVQLSCPHCTMD